MSQEASLRRTASLGSTLTLLVLACSFLPALAAKPARAWSLPVQLSLSGAVHEGGTPEWKLLADRRPERLQHLLDRALRVDPPSENDEPRDHSVTVGFLPLLLAIFACGFVRGRLAWIGRGTLLLALILTLAQGVVPLAREASQPLLVLALALLAGAGLQRLGSRPAQGQGEGPLMLLAAVAVTAAAVLIAVSLRAGAVRDVDVVSALMRHIGEPPISARDAPAVIALNAAWLRAVLDRAALAAFVSMSVLLLHLKSRGTLTGVLVLLVVAADLLSVRLLL